MTNSSQHIDASESSQITSDQGGGSTRPSLLAVLAHPDDESFGMGGTLALYSRRGVDTYLLCATRGEAGDVDESMLHGYDSIAERREAELRCAAGKLGLKEVTFLGYRDSGMAGSADNYHPNALVAQSNGAVAEEIAHHIRRIKPWVVVTFDPIGGYRHPDHIAIHKATIRGIELAGDRKALNLGDYPAFTPKKLFYQTIPRGFMRMMVRVMRLTGRDPRKFGKNKDIDLASIAEVNFPIHAVIDYRSVADIRDDASSCHASQAAGSLTGGAFAWLRRTIASKELYIQASPPPNGKVERDLFAGLADLPPLHRI